MKLPLGALANCTVSVRDLYTPAVHSDEVPLLDADKEYDFHRQPGHYNDFGEGYPNVLPAAVQGQLQVSNALYGRRRSIAKSKERVMVVWGPIGTQGVRTNASACT